MKKQLFFRTIFIVLIGLLSFFAISVYITHNNNINFAKYTVIEKAEVFASLYSQVADVNSLVEAGNDARISIISPSGEVLADSNKVDIDSGENRLDRPEIQAASKGRPEAFVRHSETLNADLIYYALRVDSGYADNYVYIRVALPIARVDAYLHQSLPSLIILMLLITAVSFFLVHSISKRVVKPFYEIEEKLKLLSVGEYVKTPVAKSYEEINSITKKIDEIAIILQNSFDALSDEKNKLTYILDNIGDGLIVANKEAYIELVNFSALKMFGGMSDVIGKKINYLVSDNNLIFEIENCITNSRNALFELILKGQVYLVTIKQLPSTDITMIAFSDVTENRESAKQREEFFANASHELKTPLTAIKGFNELTALNNKDENISKYINSITRESNRMMDLISGMLKISELENSKEIRPVSLSLESIVKEVAEALSIAMNEKAIKFEIKGGGTIISEQEHAYELVKNLIENAVRYNNHGGKVSVLVKKDKKMLRLLVIDNGIGIPPEEQARIFERFYRVEKSRSTQNGGTGLGLSIVKHICNIYGWKLSLKSRVGVGTEVSVDFNS